MNANQDSSPDHDVIIIGAGVCGIYQLHRLLELDVDVTVLEAGDGPGGTWYWNRYPGCRFDSESYSYGYSFSKELLDEWDWSEHFAGQPETLRYLEHVVDRFDLEGHMQFGCKVDRCTWDEPSLTWNIDLHDGRSLTCRFLMTAIGLLSAPTMPSFEGMDTFEGLSFHTYFAPQEPVDYDGKRVAVIGTGATGVQVIAELADKVGELEVFQRRPNWCAPLHNSKITPDDMAEIRDGYDEIFARCAKTPGGFLHGPDRRILAEVPVEDRHQFWEELYNSPGFGIWLGNFRDVLMDEEANAEFSEFVANKIRERIDDPALAEKMIPTDHGFGVQRVPMETHYYEAYNRDNVHLVDLNETPLERVTPKGILTSGPGSETTEHEFDIIIYATGFDAITGAFDRIDFVGADGMKLSDKWADSPVTYLGVQIHGFPNLFTLAGPTAGSNSTNFPRGIEAGVDWATELVKHIAANGITRVEAKAEPEAQWTQHVKDLYGMLLLRKAKSWFTGYNSNVDGHDRTRYLIYNGGAPKYRELLADESEAGYPNFEMS
ncbi:MAG: NAD(P)/FAD-dependent oxidoreductase [Actinomycetia bacterium]|nr:NAD(P)/FAD-dependent oxidoreductase [Actinomycetes bacterium]